MLADVAVLVPIAGTYTYQVPPGMEVGVGSRVWVTFQGRGVEGVVLGEVSAASAAGLRLRPIARRLDGPALEPSLIELARWMAEYYMAPLGEALRLLLPPGGRAAEAKRARLSEAGQRAATGIGKALEPEELHDTSLRERALLGRIAAAGGEEKVSLVEREMDGARAALKILVKRGLVELVGAVKARVERTEEAVRPIPGAGAAVDVEARLGRSAKRRLLHARIVAAGEVTLAVLREEEPEARQHVRALVEAGLVAVETRRAAEVDPFVAAPIERTPPPTLTADQAAAMAALAPAVDAGGYHGFLLHGATGSGKTEVYLRAIERALADGRGALVLVPEISLTPQLASRFRARFGDEVAVLHSNLSDRERFDAWMRLAAGRVRIALGARSAVFAPVARLGVVVIDEEHDGSFKQEEGLRYHGRDVAMRRARAAGAVAILGSATPSVETFDAARAGRLRLLSLPGRATPRPLPTVQIVDLRTYRPDAGGLLSAPLAAAIAENLEAHEQTILFLNRRGFATFILCTGCGHQFLCRHCSVTLTFHRAAERLVCHYCGYIEAPPARCPACKAQSIERLGLGTERVEAHVAERFPTARIARLDRDTAQGKGLERVLGGVRRGEIDIVIGTQMIAKGHDFPGVTLVGVVLADHGMNLPDFRASERTFQLLEQVAGRAGRGERPGRVLIQTWNPQHPSVLRAADHDYITFFETELAQREELGYPPFSRVGLVRVDGADPLAVRAAAERVEGVARALAAGAPAEARIQLLGPAEAPISRLKGRTRWQLFVKAANPRALRAVLSAAAAVDVGRAIRLSVDVDPVSTL